MDVYRRIAELLSKSLYAVALTGAGISVESGIPDFRSEEGLWARYDPSEFGHIDSFIANPSKVWTMLKEMDDLLSLAQPNGAHLALAEMERCGFIKEVITQNVDSLHQRAGSVRVVEFHGHNRTLRCDHCGKSYPRENISFERLPPLCSCGSPLRPEFVFFGEIIPQDAYHNAIAAARKCDLMLIVGTSATVAPASHLPVIAKERGAFLLEINPSVTELSHHMADLHLAETAGKALPAILAAMTGCGQSLGT
jgi:NAD-dependent deacetylase